jgi:hypothetical protein
MRECARTKGNGVKNRKVKRWMKETVKGEGMGGRWYKKEW